jgi:hypothetical protein
MITKTTQNMRFVKRKNAYRQSLEKHFSLRQAATVLGDTFSNRTNLSA